LQLCKEKVRKRGAQLYSVVLLAATSGLGEKKTAQQPFVNFATLILLVRMVWAAESLRAPMN
jgi:hypothetical protein